jgi:hypothetical protein
MLVEGLVPPLPMALLVLIALLLARVVVVALEVVETIGTLIIKT